MKQANSADPTTGTTLSNEEPAYAAFLDLDASIEWWTPQQLQRDLVHKIGDRREAIKRMRQRDIEESLFETVNYVRLLREELDRRAKPLTPGPVNREQPATTTGTPAAPAQG
jgi:hypothetical protein